MNAYFLVILGAVCWGFSGFCAEFIFKDKLIDLNILIDLRLFFSSLLLFLISFFSKKGVKITLSYENIRDLLIFSFLGIFMCQYTYFYTIKLSNAAIATALQYTAPIFIMIIFCIKEKRFARKNELLAVFFMFIGVVLLCTNADFSSFKLSKEALISALLSSFGVVFYSLSARRLSKEYSILLILAYAMLLSSIVFGIYLKIWNIKLDLDYKALLALIMIITVGTALAFTLFMLGINKIGALKANIIATLEPISAALFSYYFLGSALLFYQLIGFVLILFSIIIAMKIK